MTEDDSQKRWIFKVVMLGDYAVGKTCIVRRYVSDTFDEDYKATLGVDISSQELDYEKDKVQLQIWDLSGQSDFRLLRTQFLKNSDCAIIVYDVTRPDSLENISNWIHEAHTIIPGLPVILVGNKADLTQERKISQDQAQKRSKEFEMLFHVETSAKSGENINLLFKNLSKRLLLEKNSD